MALVIHPATAARFGDVRAILGPKREGAQGCWCLAIRFGPREDSQIKGSDRASVMQRLCANREHAPGILAYDEETVVGWAGTSPLEETYEFTHGSRYPQLSATGPLWVLWCLRVRAGYGGRGVASALVSGAVDYAQTMGASGIVGFPVDNGTSRVDRTLASVGTRAMFERAGFGAVASVAGKRAGFPQVAMRRDFGSRRQARTPPAGAGRRGAD